jgi:uncharacterized RDD family membrane protein YckC
MNKYSKTKYAGFWTRSIAFVIDAILTALPLLLTALFVERVWIVGWRGWLLWGVLYGLYHTLLLSSRWRATIGQKIVGIYTLNDDLSPLTLFDALTRMGYALITYAIASAPLWLLATDTLRFESLASYLLFPLASLPILMLLILPQKKTLHDWLSRTCLIDPHYKKSPLIKSIRTIGILSVSLLMALLLFILYLNIAIYPHAKPLPSTPTPPSDFNDSRIAFYNHALHRYHRAFIEADSIYGIFAMDIKREFATACISASLRDLNITQRGTQIKKFLHHAHYIDPKKHKIIKQWQANERYLSQHFYEYHLQDANRIIETIIYQENSTQQSCDEKRSVEQLYRAFIEQYIYNRESDLFRYKNAYHTAPIEGELNKAFYKKQIQQGIEWLKILYHYHPQKKE